MAHNISQNRNNEHEMFVAGEPAWHRLGKVVPEPVKWSEAAQLAGMTWEIEKRQLEYAGKPVEAWGLFRGDDNRFISPVGRVFEPIQWNRMFDFVDSVLQVQDGSHYESAGILGMGETGWCLARIPEDIRITGTDDISKTYFLFTNYHMQGKSAIGKLCSTRVVCNNTLQMALRENGNIVRISHLPFSKERAELAKNVILGGREQIKDLNTLMNALAKVEVNMDTIKEVLLDVYPNVEKSIHQQSRARTVLEIFEDNDNNAFPSERGTAYNLLNSFTKYTDHFQSGIRVRDTEKEEMARARNAMFGLGETFKFTVLQSIVKSLHKRSLIKVDTSLVSL